MNKSLKNINSISLNQTPQSEQADPRQVLNKAGGYVFKAEDVDQLRRFLILGTEGGTYYSSEQELTQENAKHLNKMLNESHKTAVDTIVDVSLKGSAPKQDTVLFALAMASAVGTDEEKRYAMSKLPEVARIGTHLFQFASYVQQFRGWGRGLRKAVANWYTEKDADALAYQAVKYRNREGWTHRDLLRLAHPNAVDSAHKDLFKWIVGNGVGDNTPRLVEGFLKAQKVTSDKDFISLVNDYGLTWEMLPDKARTAKVWAALVEKGMPMTALIRQLPTLTRLGVVKDLGGMTVKVVSQITDEERLKKARVHPIQILKALDTYKDGRSQRSKHSWTAVQAISDALEDAFYKSFEFVEPSNKRTMVALDVSGSMTWERAMDNLTPRDLSAALAMVTLRTEPQTFIGGFSHNFVKIPITKKDSLTTVIGKMSRVPMGGTDCALPMEYARKNKMEVDTFIIYADSETWGGYTHPYQALENYRQSSGIDAKLIVNGMTATDSSITNPSDPRSLSVVGFDPAVPKLIADFSRGL